MRGARICILHSSSSISYQEQRILLPFANSLSSEAINNAPRQSAACKRVQTAIPSWLLTVLPLPFPFAAAVTNPKSPAVGNQVRQHAKLQRPLRA